MQVMLIYLLTPENVVYYHLPFDNLCLFWLKATREIELKITL